MNNATTPSWRDGWLKLLPGFEWLSWPSFFIGLAESYGYGWYFTLIWVPIYNFVAARQKEAKAPLNRNWQ